MIKEIEIQKVSKQYPNGFKALNQISLSINKGDFFTLLGPNGAGKSTLVKILSTFIKKDGGTVILNGKNIDNEAHTIRKIIGVSLQNNDLDPTETPRNLLIFQARIYGMSKANAIFRADELIDMFKLEEYKNLKTSILSGGNKRKIHCALALVHNPQILFIDEPTVGMDPEARDNFWTIINNLHNKKNVTIFLTTQYLEEADKYASNMAFINEGKILYSGKISDFKKTVYETDEISLNDSYLKYIKSISNNQQ